MTPLSKKRNFEDWARDSQQILGNCLDEELTESKKFEREEWKSSDKEKILKVLQHYQNMQTAEKNEDKKEAENKKMSLHNQEIFQCFYFFLDEECRAYLIDLRVEWLGNRSRNWHTNFEVCTKSLIFLLNLYWGLLWSRVKHVNPMRRQRRF